MKNIIFIIILFCKLIKAQSYTSYFTGNINDTVTNPLGGVCLMGGASEDDNAMKWFLQRANGGDVLVLRASGSNGYNNYFYSTLGVSINSVETIVCNNSSASFDPYVLQKIQQAEAIWFAGGNQWTYVSYWRNTPVDSLINLGIKQKNMVIGGTSAGMAIQGKYYFSAQNGTVTSSTALADPYNSSVTVDSAYFIKNKYLDNVITDTHFDNPDRKGRLMAFLSRIVIDYGKYAQAIACDEYTAVCIDTSGMVKVFGGYPTYDDNAYLIQSNCELISPSPETCVAGTPLTWNLNNKALKVYNIKGTANPGFSFSLKNWKNIGNTGNWLDWSVNNGTFNEQVGDSLNCNATYSNINNFEIKLKIFPN
ncbi:MAG: cyanophycinase, partial [Bacteroidota bacterium]